MTVSAEKIAEVLGGRRVLGRNVKTMRDLDEIVRRGIPKSALDSFLSRITPARERRELSVQLRHRIVPRTTYQRVGRLNLQASETTERLARLYAIATAAFDDPEAARRFLMTPHPELDDHTPFDTALTEIGGRVVKEVIERGLHGLPA
jgi:putative toxin-antitoxin system antitoxin component (TIGR02293 family)